MAPQPAFDGPHPYDLPLFCLGLLRFFKPRLACGTAFTSVRISICVCVGELKALLNFDMTSCSVF